MMNSLLGWMVLPTLWIMLLHVSTSLDLADLLDVFSFQVNTWINVAFCT